MRDFAKLRIEQLKDLVERLAVSGAGFGDQ